MADAKRNLLWLFLGNIHCLVITSKSSQNIINAMQGVVATGVKHIFYTSVNKILQSCSKRYFILKVRPSWQSSQQFHACGDIHRASTPNLESEKFVLVLPWFLQSCSRVCCSQPFSNCILAEYDLVYKKYEGYLASKFA